MSNTSTRDLPAIAALFVTVFHKTEGYKIIFARPDDVNLDGCEYKCLPSGVEKIQDDVVYFVHGERERYIGLAVYRNLQDPGKKRNEVSCCSIAVLVKAGSHNLRHQQINKIWLFGPPLRELVARFDSQSSIFFDEVEDLYEQHKQPHSLTDSFHERNTLSHQPPRRNHTKFEPKPSKDFASLQPDVPSTAKALIHELSDLHPVLSLHDLVSFFGPLTFPLFRAALCRKRILLVSSAPVQRACHFVYNIQLLSAIPNKATTLKRPSPLRQLFCLGLNDVPLLEALSRNEVDDRGWIGTTTDTILVHKTHLYDLVVRLPDDSRSTSSMQTTARPTMTTSDGKVIQPSYLDGHNFLKLKPSLPLYSDINLTARSQISWKRALIDGVFSGYLYWASAGQSIDFEDSGISLTEPSPVHSPNPNVKSGLEDPEESCPLLTRGPTILPPPREIESLSTGQAEVLTLILFHRYTSRLLAVLDTLSCESQDEVCLSRSQMFDLGLTPRLSDDVAFIRCMGMKWFGREVAVDSSFWPCC